MSNRLITVMSAFYNAEEFIETAHQSLLNQTYKNWEWICVDDCSTDDTLKTLKKWAKEDSRIKVIARDVNGGNLASSFNYGMKYCTGTHVQILGHDDELTPDTLEEIAKRLDETQADIIIPDAEVVNDFVDPSMENFKMIAISYDKNDKKYPPNDRSVILTGEEACKLSLNWRIHAWACIKTDILRKIKFEQEGMNGDEYSERLFFLNADKVAFSKGLYRYLRRPGSITNKMKPNYFYLFPTQERLHKLAEDNHFEKKYIQIINNCILGLNFKLSMMYLINKDNFSEEEKQKIIPMLRHGRRLKMKYCSPVDIIKNESKIYFYKALYKLWRYFSDQLGRKKFI